MKDLDCATKVYIFILGAVLVFAPLICGGLCVSNVIKHNKNPGKDFCDFMYGFDFTILLIVLLFTVNYIADVAIELICYKKNTAA